MSREGPALMLEVVLVRVRRKTTERNVDWRPRREPLEKGGDHWCGCETGPFISCNAATVTTKVRGCQSVHWRVESPGRTPPKKKFSVRLGSPQRPHAATQKFQLAVVAQSQCLKSSHPHPVSLDLSWTPCRDMQA